MSRISFLHIICALLSLLNSPVFTANLYQQTWLPRASDRLESIQGQRQRLDIDIDAEQNKARSQIIKNYDDLKDPAESETTTQSIVQIDDSVNNENDESDPSVLLREILIKQESLEAAFTLILENSENNSTTAFIREQFDELKQLIKAEKSQKGGELPLHDEHLNCLSDCNGEQQIFEDCRTAVTSKGCNEDVYLMRIPGSNLPPFYAYCIFAEGSFWMIMQRREDGSENFYRNWQDYKKGFGNAAGEYWLGLERLNALTKNRQHELLIMLEDYLGKISFLKYTQFAIGEETEGFKLSLKKHNKNIDGLSVHNGKKFSTYDRDNDNVNLNCARRYKAAWWYDDCYSSNLNGRYFSYAESYTPHGITWCYIKPSFYKVYMAIRPSENYMYTKLPPQDVYHDANSCP